MLRVRVTLRCTRRPSARQRILRRLDFNSLHIIRRLLSSPSRNTAVRAEQVGEQAADTAGPEAVRVVAREAARVVELAAVRAGQAAALAERAEARAALEVVRAPAGLASAVRIAIRLTTRRGRLFRNFPRRLRPISR